MYEKYIKKGANYLFVDEGPREAETILLLHGLFGTASNFDSVILKFSTTYRVILPVLPIFTISLKEVSLKGMVKYLESFLVFIGLEEFHLLGNSLGGHIALLYALQKQEQVRSLILTGSSGLYESAFGSSMPKRNSRAFIEERMRDTFYDPKVITDAMVDEVFGIVNNRMTALRVIKMAKSAIRNNLEKDLEQITVPTYLIWGKDDKITPPFVAEKFKEGIHRSELALIDHCGHAAMIEQPETFNQLVEEWLRKQKPENCIVS